MILLPLQLLLLFPSAAFCGIVVASDKVGKYPLAVIRAKDQLGGVPVILPLPLLCDKSPGELERNISWSSGILVG